jgi:outer membrane protein
MFSLALCPLASSAQTPPIKPNTPDVQVPPPIVIPPPKTPAVPPLTVDEAVDIALKNQPLIANSRAAIEAAAGRTQQARSALLPQVGVNAGFSETRELRGGVGSGGGSPNRFTSNVSVEQLLFDFERTRDTVRQQTALERASRRAFSATQNDVAFNVRRAYWTLKESLELVDIAEATVANRQRQLDLANARLNEGLGAPGDVVRAKTGLADGVLSLESARNAALNARVNLAELLGIDPRTPLTLGGGEEGEEGGELRLFRDEFEALVTTALELRPEVMEARERLAAARFGVSAASKLNLPTFSIVGTVGARGQDDPFASSTATLGINVRWNLFDAGLAAGRRREAAALEEQARANLDAVTQTVISDVSNAYLDMKHAEQREETARVQRENARELLRISEGRYAGGIGTFLEVTDAQTSLTAAERNVATAEADVFRARAALRRAIGQILG